MRFECYQKWAHTRRHQALKVAHTGPPISNEKINIEVHNLQDQMLQRVLQINGKAQDQEERAESRVANAVTIPRSKQRCERPASFGSYKNRSWIPL